MLKVLRLVSQLLLQLSKLSFMNHARGNSYIDEANKSGGQWHRSFFYQKILVDIPSITGKFVNKNRLLKSNYSVMIRFINYIILNKRFLYE